METTKSIYGFVDITGDSISKIINGMFDVVDSSEIVPIYNYVSYNNGIRTESHTKSIYDNNISMPFVEIIEEKINNQIFPIQNIKITFVKDDVIYENNNLISNGSKRIVDTCITNSEGKYFAFVEDGIYTIKVEGGKYNKTFYNKQIINGIKEHFYTIRSLIQKREINTLSLVGTNDKLIQGIMVDEHKKPIENAEIIISQVVDNIENLVMYCKTNNEGKYEFALPLGVYNVRLRSPKHSVVIVNNLNFEEGHDFVSILNEKTYSSGGILNVNKL